MAQQEGPFSEYLNPAIPPELRGGQLNIPKPTGLEGPGLGAAHIALNFLQGLREGRAHKLFMKESEEARKERMLATALESLHRAQMLPEARARHEAAIHGELAKRVAGVKETSKDTGNPLTDFFKQLGSGLIGGQPVTGKKADIDLNVAMNAFAAAADPRNSINEELSRLDRQAHEEYKRIASEAQKEGRPVTDEDLNKSAVLANVHSRYQFLKPTVRTPLQLYQSSTVSGLNPYQAQQIAEQKLKQEQTQKALDSLSRTKEGLPEGTLSPEIVSEIQRAADTLKRPSLKVSRVHVIDEAGNITLADQVEGHSGLSGFYDAKTRKLLPPNVSKATQIQINRGSPEAIAKAVQSAKSTIAELAGVGSPLFTAYSNALSNARSPEDINKIIMQASKAYMSIKNQEYTEKKDANNLALALNKAENALPAKKQLRNVNALYETVMDNYRTPERRKEMNANPAAKAHVQGVLINLIAKAIDPDSVIRPSEFQQWAEKAVGMDKLNLWMQSHASGSHINLRPEDEEALLGIADNLINSLKRHVSEEQATLRQGINVSVERKQTSPTPATTPGPVAAAPRPAVVTAPKQPNPFPR